MILRAGGDAGTGQSGCDPLQGGFSRRSIEVTTTPTPPLLSPLAHRLMAPAVTQSLDDLRRAWFQMRIDATVPGFGGLAGDLTLLRRVRGGIGRVLMEGASDEALAGYPCPWQPPSASDLFFREQGRIGAHGIPKPFILGAAGRDGDLIITLTLFGLAADWAPILSHALAATLRHRIDWAATRTRTLPAAIGPLTLEAHQGLGQDFSLDAPIPPASYHLDFITPMNAEGDDPILRPATIIARLARRVEGLARWQDTAIADDWDHLAHLWYDVDYDTRGLAHERMNRHSGRGQQGFTVPTISGRLTLRAVPAVLIPLLIIGAETAIGKGATEGFGRYRLTRTA